MGWVWFLVVQLVSFLAMVAGWIVLIPFCVVRAWIVDAKSNKDERPIDRWRWGPLNWIYGNPEDGVSGGQAIIWTNSQQVPYMPDAWVPWRAYCWSAWRNSTDNLKYLFKWVGGPFYRWQSVAFYVQLGWSTSGLPVLSAGRI